VAQGRRRDRALGADAHASHVAPRSLHIVSDPDRLAELRAFVRDTVADFGGSQRVADDLVQAVDEAACNVMLHGYRGKPGEIDVEASLLDRAVQIRILDRAPAFDPIASPIGPLGGAALPSRQGGMGVGIRLVRTMTDAVHHAARPGGGNELTLLRSIDEPAEED
jgi:serine/threonine-protein kinase RsbW